MTERVLAGILTIALLFAAGCGGGVGDDNPSNPKTTNAKAAVEKVDD